MRMVTAIFAGCVMVAAIASMLVSSYFSIRASLNRRRPSRRWYVRMNPFNAVLFEDELMPEGLKYRTKSFRAMRVALISLAALMAAVTILGLTRTN